MLCVAFPRRSRFSFARRAEKHVHYIIQPLPAQGEVNNFHQKSRSFRCIFSFLFVVSRGSKQNAYLQKKNEPKKTGFPGKSDGHFFVCVV